VSDALTFINRQLTCRICGAAFTWWRRDQQHYRERGLQPRAVPCTEARHLCGRGRRDTRSTGQPDM